MIAVSDQHFSWIKKKDFSRKKSQNPVVDRTRFTRDDKTKTLARVGKIQNVPKDTSFFFCFASVWITKIFCSWKYKIGAKRKSAAEARRKKKKTKKTSGRRTIYIAKNWMVAKGHVEAKWLSQRGGQTGGRGRDETEVEGWVCMRGILNCSWIIEEGGFKKNINR